MTNSITKLLGPPCPYKESLMTCPEFLTYVSKADFIYCNNTTPTLFLHNTVQEYKTAEMNQITFLSAFIINTRSKTAKPLQTHTMLEKMRKLSEMQSD